MPTAVCLAIIAYIVFKAIDWFMWGRYDESHFLGAVAFWIVLFLALLIGHPPDGDYHRVARSVPIYSVERGSEIHGEFTLGCGTVDQRAVFYFYKSEQSGFALTKTFADETVIYETDETTPHVEIFHDFTNSSLIRFLRGTWLANKRAEIDCGGYGHKWRMFVPKGTIRKEFHL